MIDLTDYYHKKGVMILSSKDVRTIDKSLFDYQCNLGYLDNKLVIIKSRIDELNIDKSIKAATMSDIDYMLQVIAKGQENIDKARDVFR